MTIALLIVLILLILNPNISSTSVITASNLWLNTLVPVLLPSMIIMDFISKSKCIDYISNLLFPIFRFLFNIRYPKSVSLILFSYISGAPSSTKLINLALENNEIDKKEADSLIYSFSSLSISYIFFILNKASINIFHYLITFTLFSINLMRIFNRTSETTINNKSTNNQSLLSTFYTSISKTTNILFTILGIMICFNVILMLFLPNDILYPIFEVLIGQQKLLALEINKKLRDFILSFSLCFLGFSLHLQIQYVYNDLNYPYFIMCKTLQALFSSWFLLI